jgi:hypothetical protein
VNVGERIILRWILEKYEVVVWNGFIWFRVGTMAKKKIYKKVGKFLSS